MKKLAYVLILAYRNGKCVHEVNMKPVFFICICMYYLFSCYLKACNFVKDLIGSDLNHGLRLNAPCIGFVLFVFMPNI